MMPYPMENCKPRKCQKCSLKFCLLQSTFLEDKSMQEESRNTQPAREIYISYGVPFFPVILFIFLLLDYLNN